MHLLRCLHFFSAYNQLRILSDHVPGKDIIAADALSCNYNSIFSSVAPQLSTQLEADVQAFFERSLATSTTQTYQSAKRHYILFCQASNSQLLPLTEVNLCKFVVYLANQKLKHQTIKVYLSGLHHLQIAEGLGDPFLPGAFRRLEYVLKGINHTPAAQSKDTRLPISPPILRRLRSVWAPQAQDPDVVMLWAACCLGFFGFMRAEEFTCSTSSHFDPESMLSPEDVSVDQHQSPSLLHPEAQMQQNRPL